MPRTVTHTSVSLKLSRNRYWKQAYIRPFHNRWGCRLLIKLITTVSSDKVMSSWRACSESWSSWRSRLSCDSSCSLCSSRTRILASSRPLCCRNRRASTTRSTSPFAWKLVSAVPAAESSPLTSFSSPSARRSWSYSSCSALQWRCIHSLYNSALLDTNAAQQTINYCHYHTVK